MGLWEMPETAERFGIWEAVLDGPCAGNPFVDASVQGEFSGEHETVCAQGFYDGDGVYRLRFMPGFEGAYTFRIQASFLNAPLTGSFQVLPARHGNHGPVRVKDKFHFAYADGTPYYSIGTTCYVWALQPDERVRQTLETLKGSAFNKIRFCILPKHYDYNLGEPRSYPYEGTPMDSSVLTKENFFRYTGAMPGNDWNFTRFCPAHFRRIEACIAALGELGIQADLIVMHPYDRWGFSCMTKEQDALYWRYVLARFSAYHNVWWSLANEYDLMRAKTMEDWEAYAALICALDPYGHLRSIHNCGAMYDHTRPWITHCSIQRQDLYKSGELVDQWRAQFGKPVVMDEIAYEGDIQHGWGNINGEEMLRRFWETACRGGYPGHGETYMHPEDILWWSHGGELHGESHKRFGLLHQVLAQTPGSGLKPFKTAWDEVCAIPEGADENERVKPYYLFYYSFMRPMMRDYYFDDATPLRVRVIDTWNASVEDLGVFCGHFRIPLGGRCFMAVQMIREA